MTTTTKLSLTTALRGLADHLDRYNLADDVIGIRLGGVSCEAARDRVVVHVYQHPTLLSWIASLDDVTALAEVYSEDSLHVEVLGVAAERPLCVVFCASPERHSDLHSALLAALDPEFDEYQPIDVALLLGGAA
jgi:hypothetical protein